MRETDECQTKRQVFMQMECLHQLTKILQPYIISSFKKTIRTTKLQRAEQIRVTKL